jgi:hypothetical protein
MHAGSEATTQLKEVTHMQQTVHARYLDNSMSALSLVAQHAAVVEVGL